MADPERAKRVAAIQADLEAQLEKPYDQDGLRDTEPPFFFRRVWMGGTSMDEVTMFERRPDGTLLITTGVPEADLPQGAVGLEIENEVMTGLVIYGRAVDVDDAHDQEYIEGMRARGQVFAQCFSEVETRGETGCHPLAAVTEISRDEFEAARCNGWRE